MVLGELLHGWAAIDWDLGVLEMLLRLVLGMVLGFAIGLTGVGGGVLVVPALDVLLAFSTPVAVATASAYSFLTKIYAAIEHWRLGTIDFANSLIFLAGAVPGSIVAALTVKRFADNEAFTTGLGWFIILTILLSGGFLLLDGRRRKLRERAADEAGRTAGADAPEARASAVVEGVSPRPRGRRLAAGVLLGLLTGALIGATSVGGGVMVIPVLVLCFGLPIGRTVGSSILIAVVLTFASSLVYLFVGGESKVEVFTACLMAVGSLIGVAFGSRLSTRLSEHRLRAVVIAMILIAVGAMSWGQLS